MRKSIAGLIAVAGLLFGVLPSEAHTGWSLDSVKGRWGFVEEFTVAENYGNSIGIVTFDGRGSCTIEAVVNGGDAPEGRRTDASCEYTLSRGGRGTITSSDLPDYAFVLGEHGDVAFIMRTERQQFGWGEMRPMVAAPTAGTIKGGWAWVHPAELAGARSITLGIMRFDGVGQTSERWWENGGAYQNGAQELTAEFEYTVRRSGWVEKGSDLLLVVGGGEHLYFMHTLSGNVGWGLLTRV